MHEAQLRKHAASLIGRNNSQGVVLESQQSHIIREERM